MNRLKSPIDVQIELTENCNLRCIHCYNHWRYKNKKKFFEELNKDSFLFILEKLNSSGVSMVTFTGGEPFLKPKILFSLIKKAKEYNMEVGINSNACLIKEGYAKILHELNLNHILISVLGTKETHNSITCIENSYEKTIQGIKHLVRAKLNVAVNIVVSKLNKNEVYKVGELVKDLGVRTFCATPMVPSHESHIEKLLTGEECKETLRTLLRIKEKLNLEIDTLEPIARCLFNENEDGEFLYFLGNRICSAAVSSCVVSSKGIVRPCIHADKEFGNLLYEEISEIWECMKFWSSPDILPKECRICNANIVCEGGCRMSAKFTCGEYNGKDMYMTEPIMDMTRVKKLPLQKTDSFLKITGETLLAVNPRAKIREEDFGGIVSIGSKIEFLTSEGLTFIDKLKLKRDFTPNSISKELNHRTNEVISIIDRLVQTDIIVLRGIPKP